MLQTRLPYSGSLLEIFFETAGNRLRNTPQRFLERLMLQHFAERKRGIGLPTAKKPGVVALYRLEGRCKQAPAGASFSSRAMRMSTLWKEQLDGDAQTAGDFDVSERRKRAVWSSRRTWLERHGI